MNKRLFIAVPVPDDHPIIDSMNQLRKGLVDLPITWTNPEKLHLTLCFLGNVNEVEIPEIKAIVADVSEKFSRFSVIFNEIGAFPNLEDPKTIWFGFNHSQVLADLSQELRLQLSQIGIKVEGQQFTAHITVGRATDQIDDFITRVRKLQIRAVGTVSVMGFELFESKMTKEGSQYISLAKYSF